MPLVRLGLIEDDYLNPNFCQGGSKNIPLWESKEQKVALQPGITPEELETGDKLAANVSSVILKVWRMYFTLIHHVNHPPPLSVRRVSKDETFP